MQTQKAELLKRVSAHGWSFERVKDWDAQWWADEIWQLKSLWSPLGSCAYLTFLVDPMIDDWQHRKSGENVWAVQITKLKPKGEPSEKRFLISLNQGWQKELPALLEFLSSLRGQSA